MPPLEVVLPGYWYPGAPIQLTMENIKDFGGGVSPFPMLLNMRGAKVHMAYIEKQNEWGVLDYNQFNKNIFSHKHELTGTMLMRIQLMFFILYQ